MEEDRIERQPNVQKLSDLQHQNVNILGQFYERFMFRNRKVNFQTWINIRILQIYKHIFFNINELINFIFKLQILSLLICSYIFYYCYCMAVWNFWMPDVKKYLG